MIPGEAIRRRREFVAAHVRDAQARGQVPTFGSPDWHALPYSSPLRWAAVLIAAEAWAVDGDDIPARMRAELVTEQAVAEQLHAEAFAELAAKVRALASTPTVAELRRRRAEVAS